MRIFQGEVSGTPYVMGDVIIVDHLDYGATIDNADYDLAPIQADIGTLSADATIEWKALDVTAAVQHDLASGRPTTRFRLQFRNDAGAGSARATGLTDLSGNPTANPPELQVTYRLK